MTDQLRGERKPSDLTYDHLLVMKTRNVWISERPPSDLPITADDILSGGNPYSAEGMVAAMNTHEAREAGMKAFALQMRINASFENVRTKTQWELDHEERQRLRDAILEAVRLWYHGVPCKPPNRRQRIAEAQAAIEDFEAAQEAKEPTECPTPK